MEQEECLKGIAEEFARKHKRIPRIQVRHLWEDEARRAVWVGRLWHVCEHTAHRLQCWLPYCSVRCAVIKKESLGYVEQEWYRNLYQEDVNI